ncbi:MAG: hypothetical protein ABI333_13300 [bacterium]
MSEGRSRTSVSGLLSGLLLGAVLLGVGCQDRVHRVVIEIASAGFIPTQQLDEIEVTISASRTATGDQLCEPYTRRFNLDPTEPEPITLPLRIAVEPGDVYDKVLYVRVVGRFDGTIRLKAERMVSLAGGDVTLQVLLTSDCIGVGTGAGQHCQAGLPLESPLSEIFDDRRFVEGGEQCLVE